MFNQEKQKEEDLLEKVINMPALAKILIGAAMVLLVAMSVYAVLLAWFGDVGQKQSTTQETATTTDEIATTTASISDDWKTYRNEEYGFEIKYPDGWEISERNPEGMWFEYAEKEFVFKSGGDDDKNSIILSITTPDSVTQLKKEMEECTQELCLSTGFHPLTCEREVSDGNFSKYYNGPTQDQGKEIYSQVRSVDDKTVCQENTSYLYGERSSYREMVWYDSRGRRFQLRTFLGWAISDEVLKDLVVSEDIEEAGDKREVGGVESTEVVARNIMILKKMLHSFKETDGKTNTSNWKTYRNEEYGFEISYPLDWSAEMRSTNTLWWEAAETEIVFEKQTDSVFPIVLSITTEQSSHDNIEKARKECKEQPCPVVSLRPLPCEDEVDSDYLDDYNTGRTVDADTYMQAEDIAGKSVCESNTSYFFGEVSNFREMVWYSPDGDRFQLRTNIGWLPQDKELSDLVTPQDIQKVVMPRDNAGDIAESVVIMKEMLKSFQFDDSTVDTSDWKTYRNERYGFEIRIPGDWEASRKERSEFSIIFSPEGSCCHGVLPISLHADLRADSIQELKQKVDQHSLDNFIHSPYGDVGEEKARGRYQDQYSSSIKSIDGFNVVITKGEQVWGVAYAKPVYNMYVLLEDGSVLEFGGVYRELERKIFNSLEKI